MNIFWNKGRRELWRDGFSNCLRFSIISEEKNTAGGYDKDNCSVWLALGVGRVKEFCLETEYDAEALKEDTSIVIVELVSAVVDGKKTGVRRGSTR